VQTSSVFKSALAATCILAALLFYMQRNASNEPVVGIDDRQAQVESTIPPKTVATDIQQEVAVNASVSANMSLSNSLTAQVTDESGGVNVHIKPINNESDYDRSVIGQRFPISTSILNRCGRSFEACHDSKVLIVELESEPRDVAWAQSLESKLRSKMLSSKSGANSIRALECRVSLCAFEVASADTSLGTWLPNAVNPIETHLVIGNEFDDSNFRILVHLIVFRVPR
jgi:hypothetical protein